MRSHCSGPGLVLVGALLLGCTPSVVIDAPDIEITQPNLQFPAAPARAGAGTSVQGQFRVVTNKLGSANSSDAGSLKQIERLLLTRVALEANAGIQDFGFLDHLTVVGEQAFIQAIERANKLVPISDKIQEVLPDEQKMNPDEFILALSSGGAARRRCRVG